MAKQPKFLVEGSEERAAQKGSPEETTVSMGVYDGDGALLWQGAFGTCPPTVDNQPKSGDETVERIATGEQYQAPH